MARIRTGFVSGTITNDPLASGGTTLNASALADLAAISSPDIAVIILDADGSAGAPEIVHVTAHTGSATSATISRAQEGSSNREHVTGTDWVHAPTVTDFVGAKGADITSTASMTLPDTGEDYFDITGTDAITSISERASGRVITFQFDAALTFTHNGTNLILLGAENITTVAGDTITLVSEGAGNWREIARNFPWPTTTAGDIDYADAARSRNRLGIGTAGQALLTNSAANAPEWGSLHLGEMMQNFVEAGRATPYFLHPPDDIAIADNTVVSPGIRVEMSVTGTVTASANSELPNGYELFVTAAGDDAGFIMGTTTSSTVEDWVMGCRVIQGASVVNQEFFMGLSPNAVEFDGTKDTSIGWRLSGTGNYIGFTDTTGTETTVDSSNNDTSVHTLRFEISGGGTSVSFFFDNALVGSAVTTNIPSSTSLQLKCGLTGISTPDRFFRVSDVYAFRGN